MANRANPIEECRLGQNEVHVWRANLNGYIDRINCLEKTLSMYERERADKFRREVDRRRFVLGRGLLRSLIGRCLAIRPNLLRFNYDQFGKPELAVGTGDSKLRFNVSHSGELVLIALAVDRAVGIDVERVRTDLAIDQIAPQFLSPHESEVLATLEPTLRCESFFIYWTRKEAYLKAVGVGLSLQPHLFDVSSMPGQQIRLVSRRRDGDGIQCWILQDLEVGRHYKAALAVQGSGWQLKIRPLHLEHAYLI